MTAAEAELPTPEDTRSDAYRLAADLQGLASASRATQLGEWNGEGVPGWVGEAEDAYTSSIQYLDGKLNSLVAALNHAVSQAWAWGDALGRAISEIPKLHEAWEEVMIWEAKEKERYSHAVETGEMDPGLAWVGKQSVEEEARQQQSDLRKKHKQLMQDLDDAAAELAGRVNEARARSCHPRRGTHATRSQRTCSMTAPSSRYRPSGSGARSGPWRLPRRSGRESIRVIPGKSANEWKNSSTNTERTWRTHWLPLLWES